MQINVQASAPKSKVVARNGENAVFQQFLSLSIAVLLKEENGLSFSTGR
jgi:hypothetical protein